MSLDRIGRYVLSPGSNAQVNTGNAAPFHWDDDVGLLGLMYNLAITGEDATNTYHVIQLDGSMTWRNKAALGFTFGIDMRNPNTLLRVDTNTSGASSTHTWTLSELEKRTGTVAYRGGVAQQPAVNRLTHTYNTNLPGVIASNLRPLFIDKDRIYVVNSVTGGGVTPAYWLGWLPLNPASPQIITNVLFLTGAGVFRNYTVSRSDNPRRIWLAEGWSASLNAVVKEFDLDSLTVTRTEIVMYDTGSTSQWFHGIWWSKKFKVFIALYTNASNEKAILILSPERVPASLLAPIFAMPGEDTGSNRAQVTGVSIDNPMKIRLATSVATWLAGSGGPSGARAGLFTNDLLNDDWGVPFSGYTDSAVYNLNSPRRLYPPDQAFGASLPVTVIDDNTISLPIDGSLARDNLEVTWIDNAADYGQPGKSFVYLSSVRFDILQPCKVKFHGFEPSSHPLNDMVVDVAAWDDGTTYSEGFELNFDVATMPAISTYGHVVLEENPDGYIPFQNMTVDSGRLSCNVIAIDRDVHPAVLTVQDPEFLSNIGLATNGAVGTIQIMDKAFTYSPFFGIWTITRTDVDKFTTNRPRIQFMTEQTLKSLEAGPNPILEVWAFLEYTAVGRRIFFNGAITGMPMLTNATATITEWISTNRVRINIDTTGGTPITEGGAYHPPLYLYDQPHPGMRLVVMEDQSGPSTPETKQGVGIKVSTTVLDDFGLPCANQRVQWSANQPGVFTPEVTITNEAGEAETIFIPSMDYLGSVSVTATAVFP